MYESVFELLKGKKLTDDSHIETSIMAEWPFSKVLDFVEKLFVSIEADSLQKSDFSINDYPFLANSNMSGQHNGGCIEWNCRLNRVEQLARFSILYVDCLYLPNYFSDYKHVQFHIQNDYDRRSLRYHIVGDIKILLKLKPLLRSGIVRFLPTTLMLCSSCFAKINQRIGEIDSRLLDQIKLLDKSFSETTTAKLQIVNFTNSLGIREYQIDVTCDEALFEHGQYIKIVSELPRIFQRKIDNNPSQHQFSLTKSEILRGHVNTDLIESIARDISLLKFHQERFNLKYLTDRSIDVSLLQAINDEKLFKDYNDILASYLAFKLPIFQYAPLDSLLAIRQNEQDSFFSYRTALNQILRQHILQQKTISAEDAKQIYSDVMYPEIKKLNNKVNAIRKSSLTKSLKRLAIATGALTFGLCSNFITPSFQSALYGLGLMAVYDSAKSISNAVRPDKEIRNDNFYFLWKVFKKSKKI